ncbi:MAG: FtsX-like permease family protein [Salinivirgaceae bacterium]|nr:FtsX-like permease family protein [Salinivirgaceae bacterium]
MKSYLKFLSRNKLYTAIEALGLVVSLAFVIVISCYTWQQFAVTREANDYQRLYSLNLGYEDGLLARPGEMALALDRIPGVEAGGRISCYGTKVKYEGNELPGHPDICQIDPVICDFFQFDFVSGSKEVLNDKSQVLLDESFARKISPDIDPVGRTIIVLRDTCIVGGIVRANNHSILEKHDIYMAIADPDVASDGYYFFMDAVFIRFREGADHEAVRTMIDTVVRRELNIDRLYSPLSLTIPYKEIYFSPRGRHCNALKHGNLTMVYVLIAVGILLLASALFNYINLSVALAGKRAKEMAIRTALGEQRGEVFRRYVVEAVLFTGACIVLAAVLAKAFVPVFNRYVAGDIGLDIAFSPAYIALYIALALIVGLVSGAIPAAITLSYNSVAVIKGEQRRQTKTVFSRVFIVIQNIITVALISLAIVMELQYNHLINMPLGANVDGLYFISCGDVGVDQLAAKPYVDKIGLSDSYPGRMHMQMQTAVDGRSIYINTFSCDKNAFDLFGFEIVRDYQVPGGKGMWLTESTANIFAIDRENPVKPKELPWFNSDSIIAGIVKDYVVDNLSEVNGNQVGIIDLCEFDYTPNAILKLNRFDTEVRADLRKLAEEESIRRYGDTRIADWYGYIPELIEKSLTETRNFISLIELFMLLATLISLLGLVAMSAYYIGLQTANIAVRKVLGGTVASEALRAVKEYMLLVGIAILIGIPVAIYFANKYLNQFYYRVDGYWWVFAVAAVIALAISFLAVLSQTLKAAKANPAVELKKE